MSGKLPLVLVASLALVSVVAAHSVEKRQTTVSFEGTYEDVRELIIRVVIAFTLATVLVVVVAPIFGYKVDLLISQINGLSGDSLASDPVYGGYEATGTGYGAASGYASPEVTPSSSYAYAGARRLLEAGSSWPWTGILNSLDIVETGFRYMDIEDESCRLKTICELESYAVSHPLASLAINTINSNLRGLDRYQTAIQAGINGEDCALIYDQCRVSYVGY